jgi:hypothetical protein
LSGLKRIQVISQKLKKYRIKTTRDTNLELRTSSERQLKYKVICRSLLQLRNPRTERKDKVR